MFRSSLRQLTRVSRVSTHQLTRQPILRTPLQLKLSSLIIPKTRTYTTNASDLAGHPKVQEFFANLQKHPNTLKSLQDIRDHIKIKTEQIINEKGSAELNESNLLEIFKDPKIGELFNKFFDDMNKAGLQITDPIQLDFLHAYIGSQMA